MRQYTDSVGITIEVEIISTTWRTDLSLLRSLLWMNIVNNKIKKAEE